MSAEQDTLHKIQQLTRRVRIALLESPSQIDVLTIARIREAQMSARNWSELVSQHTKPDKPAAGRTI